MQISITIDSQQFFMKKTWRQGCEKPWVFGILPMGSGFLPKTQGFFQKPWVFGGFLGFCYILIQSDTSESQFIHAITESYSFKTRKQISATYKPNLKHLVTKI